MDDFIVTRNLVKHYEGGRVPALQGVSLHVRRGEFVAIMGPSGCGKTTLLNVLGALDSPTSGDVSVDGVELSRLGNASRFRSNTIGFVFQHHCLIPAMTLLENVEAPMAGRRPAAERKLRAKQLLEAMGLGAMERRFPNAISGGERQRVAVARALANDPPLLLADEPTGNLDSDTGANVMLFLYTTCRRTGKTLLIATHNQEIGRQTDRILNMRNGRIEDAG